MPQKWLSNLKRTRPQIAEVLEDMCYEQVSKTIHQPPKYIAEVVKGLLTDDSALRLFWVCVTYQKEDYERRHNHGSNPN